MRYLPAGLILVLGSSAFADLVTNGSFESPSFTAGLVNLSSPDSVTISGWSIDTGNIDLVNLYWPAQDGANSIDLNGNTDGSISQSLSTTSGQRYRLTFYMSGNPDGVGGGQTSWNMTVAAGSVLSTTATFNTFTGHTTFDFSTNSYQNMGWTQFSYTFTANSSTTLLSFTSQEIGVATGPVIDNVSVTEVPEPATYLLFGAGLGGLGLWRRSQKKRGPKQA